MGKIHPDLAGAFQRSVGNVVYYLKNGENIARSKSKSPYTSKTPAQETQRGKFGDMNHLASIMQNVAKTGFPQRKRGFSAVNAFHSSNKRNYIESEDGKTVIDYEHLQCSQGPLFPPVVTATLNAESRTIAFQSEAMPGDSNCKEDDAVYAVLLDTENEFCSLTEVCKRGKGGSVSVILSRYWKTEAVVLYAFAVSANGRKASATLHLSLD